MLLAGTALPTHPTYAIELYSRSGKQLREVAVELMGPTGPHVERTTSKQGAQDSKESVVLRKVANPDVRMNTLTAVRWIDVMVVTYTDGSTWHSSSQGVCRVAPQGFLLLQ